MIRKLIMFLSMLYVLPFKLVCQPYDPADQIKTITIPSASVSSLLRFTDIPVSYYTGTPDISVPIYTINTGKLNLPIVLRYSASGIRVAENSSNVGLGWSLAAEGVLQQTILGIEDNTTYHQYGLGWDNAMLLSTDPTDQALLTSLSTGGLDGAPDLYTFSFNGLSGKFIYADVIRTLPQQNIAITNYLGSSGQPEWKFVTPDGTQYVFAKIENTANRSSESITRSKTWYLTKIVDANNTDSILLDYEPTVITEVIGRSYHFQTYRPNAPQILPFDDDMSPTDGPQPGQYTQVEQISHAWQLKTITWNNGSIEYDVAYNDRQDMSAPRVRNLLLKDRDGATIRVVHFDQSYFLTPGVNDLHGKRMKLDAVVFAQDISSLNASSAHRYVFEYSAQPLPSKLSNQIDHWGFYNGATGNEARGLIPSFTYPGMNYYGANRDANPFYTKAAMLTKMYYPTGGYAAFTWDVHSKTYPTQQLDSIIEYRDSAIHLQLACQGNEEWLVEFEDHISIPTTPVDLFGSGLDAKFSVAMGTGNQNIAEIVNTANGCGWLVERPIGTPISTTPTNKATKCFSFQTTSSYTYNTNVTLTPGKYYGVKGHIRKPGFSISATLTVKWPKKVPNTYTPPSDFLGGCRIRKIVLYDTFTHKSIVKNYEYSLPSFIAKPQYRQPLVRYYFYNNGNLPQGNATDCMYYIPIEGMFVTSNSVHNFNAGVQAGYDWVIEKIGSGDAGATKYSYTNFNELNNIGEVPASWRYGRLKEKTELDNFNNEVRKTTYNNRIALVPTEHFAGHTAEQTAAHPCYSLGGVNPVHFNQKVYDFPCDWLFTDSIKVEDYLSGIKTVTVNKYDNPQHRELTSSTTFLSDGSKVTNFIKYPTDFALSNSSVGDAAGVVRLQERHMHNMPVEQYTQKWLPGSSQPLTIGGVYQQFKTINVPFNSVVPFKVNNLEINAGISNFIPAAANTNIMSKDSRYNSASEAEEYDNACNLLTVSGVGRQKEGYIWGYQSVFPIAKVQNDFSNHSRAFTSFEKYARGNWNYQESAVVTTDYLTGKRAYNLAHPGAGPITFSFEDGGPYLPGNYVISYWKKGGTVDIPGTVNMTTGMTVNGWTYCEHLVNDGVPSGSIRVLGTGFIDELRFYPKDARMESFTYEPLIGITSRNDHGNRITIYEYDAMGRLSMEKDVHGNILKNHIYQYQGNQ